MSTIRKEFYRRDMIEVLTENLQKNGFGLEHAIAWAIRDHSMIIDSVEIEPGIHGQRVAKINLEGGARVSFFASGINPSYGWALYEVYATAHDEDDGEISRNQNRYEVAAIIRDAGDRALINSHRS